MNWEIIIMSVRKTAVKGFLKKLSRCFIFEGAGRRLLLVTVLVSACALFAQEESTQTRQPASTRSKGIKRGRAKLPQFQSLFKKTKKKVLLKYIQPPARKKLYFPEGTDEAKLEQVALLEIEQLYKIFKRDKKPDIQLRLASLYVEMGRLIESQIYEQHSIDMELYKTKKRSTLPRINLKPVRDYSNKAISLFENYLAKHSNKPRADEVLFQLGYSYFQISRPQKGKAYYEQLIRRFPKSSQLEDAHFHLGEYYFDRAQWKTARFHYDRASRFKSKFYSFSLYKIAWCFYNEGQATKAVGFVTRVIRGSKKIGQGNISFAQEAIEDLSSFYVYSKYKAKNAYSFFKNLASSNKQLNRSLARLAYAYKDAGNIQAMRMIFNLLIQLDPYHPQAYDYKYQIVQAYSYAGNRAVFRQEFQNWVQNYNQKSKWSKRNRSDQLLIQKVSKLIETVLRNHTFRSNYAFLKTKNTADRRQALFGYKLYIQYFKKSKFIDSILFHYGELLFDTNKFKQAAEQYKVVVNEHPKSKNHESAALNRVLALEKIIPSEKQIQSMVKKGGVQPFPPSLKDLEEAVGQYIKFYPKRKKVFNMMYLIAKLHLEYRHYKKAISYWMKIVEQSTDKKSPVLTQAVHSILDTYNLMKDYKSLKEVSKKFLAMPLVRSLPVAVEVRKILRQTLFNDAQQKAKDGDLKVSAVLYEQFYKENKDSKLAVLALYNAGVNFNKLDNLPKAIQIYSVLGNSKALAGHPKLKEQIMGGLADLYQKTGQYEKAARAFENYASAYPKNKNSTEFWYNAGIIYDGLNNFKKAVSCYLKYYNRSKNADRAAVYYFIADIRKRQGQLKKAIGNYSKYLSSPDKNKLTQILAAVKLAELNKKLGFVKESLKWRRRTIQIYKKLNTGVSYAAEAQFYLTYETYKKFTAIRIPANPSAQARSLQRKLSLLERLKNEVKDIIRYNYGPQVVSALTLMGMANRHLSLAIVGSPLPRGLRKKEMMQYRKALVETARPFKQSAGQYFQQAVKKAKETSGYAPWLKEAQKGLQSAELFPVQFKQRVYSMKIEGL